MSRKTSNLQREMVPNIKQYIEAEITRSLEQTSKNRLNSLTNSIEEKYSKLLEEKYKVFQDLYNKYAELQNNFSNSKGHVVYHRKSVDEKLKEFEARLMLLEEVRGYSSIKS